MAKISNGLEDPAKNSPQRTQLCGGWAPRFRLFIMSRSDLAGDPAVFDAARRTESTHNRCVQLNPTGATHEPSEKPS